MSVCHKCGFELQGPASFCPMCGAAAEERTAPAEEPDTDQVMAQMFGDEITDDQDSAVAVAETDSENEPAEGPVFVPTVDESPDVDEPVAATEADETVAGADDAELDPQTDDGTSEQEESLSAEDSVAYTAAPSTGDIEPADSEVDEFADGEIVDLGTADGTDPGTAESSDPGATAHPIGSSTSGRRPGLKPLSEGTLLNGRYRIIRKIGGGGMGAVYLAGDQNLGGIERAVKEMVQSSIEEEQQVKAIEDFKRESMILSTLEHPSIPTIYDYFFDETEGRFYLVMKYISGGDLAGRLRAASGGRIDERTVTEWSIQVADVLAYLHNLPAKIVYRDLKPSNIMLESSGDKIMLIDFGIARSINQTEKGVTAVGTMGYAPPELFSGQVEPRSDIYSLGSTMFHLLTGADPQNNPLLIFDFQKNPRPRQINPQLSDQMERILMRAVEYGAESRFASADAMKQTLVEHLDNLRAGRITYGVSEAPESVSLSNQFVFCGFCGQQIVATDLFCAFCGAKQPLAQQGVHSEIYPRTGATAKLIVDGTSELDAPVFALEKNENLVGRRDPQSNIFPEVDLSKYDPQTKISRRHARIWREGGEFLVEDLGSSNGTILLPGQSDSVRLEPRRPHRLVSGDRLRVGDTTLHFWAS